MFFYIEKNLPSEKSNPENDEANWVEIWNDVFMQYNKTKEGKYEQLAQKNVDTGMGLERTLAVINGLDDNYRTDLFWPIIEEIEKLSSKKYDDHKKEMRIIADHIKAATMIIADNKGIVPSNVEHGYIVRRLIRRAIRTAKTLGIENNFTKEIAKIIVRIYGNVYTEVEQNKERIYSEFEKEEDRFKLTLEVGLRHFNKIAETADKIIHGKDAFLLFQSYGFPIEITKELAKEKGLNVDEDSFQKEYEMHQQISREGAEKKFKSGLADTSIETTKLHTATHLLHSALRELVSKDIQQKGSNITPERLRFDFNYGQKLIPEQIKAVEARVNEAIQKSIDVKREEMSPEDARKQGAVGLFGDKYGDKVSVYTVGNVSKEICTGPHVHNTKELGKFKIIKEESVAAGIRRIKAVVESA
jgi:alanyl-tRNA synthetase